MKLRVCLLLKNGVREMGHPVYSVFSLFCFNSSLSHHHLMMSYLFLRLFERTSFWSSVLVVLLFVNYLYFAYELTVRWCVLFLLPLILVFFCCCFFFSWESNVRYCLLHCASTVESVLSGWRWWSSSFALWKVTVSVKDNEIHRQLQPIQGKHGKIQLY